ncbi:MAG: hypothetical protein IJ109_04955 [Firmicutes bacterium]|nr:hypothetical protein [Bacillota bacterium]
MPSITNILIVLGILWELVRIVCRWQIFRKMRLRPWLSLIPGVREYSIFRRCWRVMPFLVLLALALNFYLIVQIGSYVNIDFAIPPVIRSRLLVLSLICLMIITIAMYKRLAFAFGHDIEYAMGLLYFNAVFLGLLAFSKKNVFQEERAQLRRKELRDYLSKSRNLRSKIVSVVSAIVIIFTSAGYIGNVLLHEQQPAFLVKAMLAEAYTDTSGKVSGKGKVIYPAIEEGTAKERDLRKHFFPDKSAVKETTVYMYLIGSNLEDATGAASVNLAQIKDATAAGENLKFIVEAGGSGRWFTDGFKNRKTGRYMIRDGEVTLLETLPNDTCMSEPGTLEDFLKWANRNYPSDRKMLFFWDHGGGLSGFGVDVLNPREKQSLLSMSEITGALESAGDKYDVIGFDACLMQTMEVGMSLEPYADYLLASEESEPGSGMYYTAAFSRLAQEPDLDTLKFGAMMCSSYDQSLELLNGSPQPAYTMSMTDLRYMTVVYNTFIGYLTRLDEEFKTDRESFINMSTARSKAYEFQMEDQIDLIDFIRRSDIPDSEKTEMIGNVSSAIAVRNAGSANHINGIATYMPYDDLYSYDGVYHEMKKLGMRSETNVYNDFASIIGSQKSTKDRQNVSDFEDEDWYVKGFENYNGALYMQDVPLIRDGDRYRIDLTEEEWETITEYHLGLKLKAGNRYADLGSDDLYTLDENGHYTIDFDKTWVSINGVYVALHPGTPIEVPEEDKIIYTGTVDATLNFTTPITIYMRWVNVGDHEGEGEILGYLPADQDSDDIDEYGMPRGFKQFKSNNIITFLYDWYDEDGNYISTALGHMPIYVGTAGLQAKQKDISSKEFMYYGVMKDTMNRTLQTKVLHHEGK